MLRSELIQVLSDKFTDLDSRDVELAVTCMLEQMSKALESGNRIEVRGFGTFCLHTRPARMARNPKTGEILQLPAKSAVHFKPGIDMRERVNDSRDLYPIKD